MSAPELYHNDKSTCSQKVRLVLAENNIAYKDRHIDLSAEENLSAAYLAINPNGVVPALVHDGVTIIESTVICEYLCEVFPDGGGPWMPREAGGPAHTCAPAALTSTKFGQWRVRVPKRFEVIKGGPVAAMSDAEYEAFAKTANPASGGTPSSVSPGPASLENDKASAEKAAYPDGPAGWKRRAFRKRRVSGSTRLFRWPTSCLFPVFQASDVSSAVTWALPKRFSRRTVAMVLQPDAKGNGPA